MGQLLYLHKNFILYRNRTKRKCLELMMTQGGKSNVQQILGLQDIEQQREKQRQCEQ